MLDTIIKKFTMVHIIHHENCIVYQIVVFKLFGKMQEKLIVFFI